MSYKQYTSDLMDIITECKVNNINAKIGRIQADMIKGISKDFIINNLPMYV